MKRFDVDGLSIVTDGFDYPGIDRVLPIISNEQPLLCEYLRPRVGDVVIDAGTGSGVLALHAARAGCAVQGVDILQRAIQFAGDNAVRNGLVCAWNCGAYSQWVAEAESADIVVFNAPHQPTPPGVCVAVHANGGPDGLAVFREFLSTSAFHLRPDGRIIFYQMTPSKAGWPRAFEYLDDALKEGWDLEYGRVLPTYSYSAFLLQLYGAKHADWIANSTVGYPDVDLVVAEVRMGGTGRVRENVIEPRWQGTWADRISLHKLIAGSAGPSAVQLDGE